MVSGELGQNKVLTVLPVWDFALALTRAVTASMKAGGSGALYISLYFYRPASAEGALDPCHRAS